MKRSGTIFVTVVSLALVVVVALGTWDHTNKKRVVEELRPSVKLASIHLSNLLEIEAGPSNITFGEYFKKAEASVEEIDKAVVQVKSRAAVPPSDVETLALDYMNGVQTAIRSLKAKTRSTMLLSTAIDRLSSNTDEMRSSNEHTSRWALDRSSKLLEESNKAAKDYRTETDAAAVACTALESRLAGVEARFGKDAGISPDVLGKVLLKLQAKDPA